MIIVNNSQHASLHYKVSGSNPEKAGTLEPLTRTSDIDLDGELAFEFRIPASGAVKMDVEPGALITVDVSVFNPIPPDDE